MPLKQIFIQNSSYISYGNNNISIKTSKIDTKVCLDDIDIIVIDNQQTTISTAILVKLAQANICTIFIDDKHNPSSILTPLYKNSKTVKIQKAQLNIKKPKLNSLWKDIIKSKILNQADTLDKLIKDRYIYSQIKRVVSKDKNNIEAYTAQYYFRKLFQKGFSRKDINDNRNIALNYGYSIIRSSISRYIIAYGLNPSFGIWHDSSLNSFNLADDLIEPFRPLIDEYVYQNISKNIPLNSINKQELVSILLIKVKNYNNQKITVNEAIKNIVSSYQSFCLNKRDDIELFYLI